MMEKLTLFKRQKIFAFAYALIAIILILAHFLVKSYNSYGLGFILLFNAGYLLYELNKKYFKYNDEVFEYLLMYKEKKTTINRHEIESVAENWSGFIFTLKSGEQLKLSTDGLWKSDKKIISNFLKE